MLKTIIVDDEMHCINRLDDLIQANKESLTVVGKFQLYEEAKTGINALNPDVVFLDVQLGQKTGFDLLKEVDTINFDVVFTTAYDKYAVEAFQVSATDYLLKPIDSEDFERALQKVVDKSSFTYTSNQVNILLHNLQQKRQDKQKLGIPTTDGLIFILIADIIRCQSDGNYTQIYTADAEKFIVTRTLKQFDELLSGNSFFRVHNSHLINMNHIKKYNKGKGGTVIMADDSAIDVSVRRKDLFLDYLEKHQFLLP